MKLLNASNRTGQQVQLHVVLENKHYVRWQRSIQQGTKYTRQSIDLLKRANVSTSWFIIEMFKFIHCYRYTCIRL